MAPRLRLLNRRQQVLDAAMLPRSSHPIVEPSIEPLIILNQAVAATSAY